MSEPDEMGLTPEAALGYEAFFVPAIFHQWPQKLIAAGAICKGEKVLDVGCGTGVLTRELPGCVGATGSVTGFDLSESMLGVARRHCPGVPFHQGSVNTLPFDDASFDVVVSAFMLMFLESPAQALSEMRRVLRPGGRLVVSVWQGLDNNPTYAALVKVARDILDDESADSIGWPFSMGEAEKLADIFAAAALEHVSVSSHDGTARFPSLEEFVKTEIQAWLLANSVDEVKIGELAGALRAACRELDVNGEIEFPLNALIARAEIG